MKQIYPIKRSNRFILPDAPKPESLLFHTLPSLMRTWLKNKAHTYPDIPTWLTSSEVNPQSNSLKITWIGHATFLIQLAGYNILTDPIFTKPSFFFPRLLPPGIDKEYLPPIDVVLISHNHRDHMDTTSLMYLQKKYNPMFLVPDGDEHWFNSRKINAVASFTWWQEHHLNPITFSFLPAFHWSQRGLFDKNKSLWGSWLISTKKTSVYFAGDTAYGPHFKQISDHYPINVALLPIAPCEPHAWMCRTHLSGEAVAQSFLDLQAQVCIPMHWGTFGFGYDNFLDPINKLTHAFKKFCIDRSQLFIAKVGESFLSSGPTNK